MLEAVVTRAGVGAADGDSVLCGSFERASLLHEVVVGAGETRQPHHQLSPHHATLSSEGVDSREVPVLGTLDLQSMG